jgi:hypothetical protein
VTDVYLYLARRECAELTARSGEFQFVGPMVGPQLATVEGRPLPRLGATLPD